MIIRLIAVPLVPDLIHMVGEDGQGYFEPGQSPLEPRLAGGARQSAAQMRATPTNTGLGSR